jgi:protein SCO1
MHRTIAMVLLAVLCGCSLAPQQPGVVTDRRPVSLFGPSWRWTDEQGEEVSFSRWRGSPLVVTAIFTSCTVRCPLTVEKLHLLDRGLHRRGIEGQFFLVTLDPQNDDRARLQRFKETRHLPPSWHMLRGSRQQTLELGRWLGVRAIYDSGHIDHDVRIAVFDAGGRLVRSFGGWDFDENTAVAVR